MMLQSSKRRRAGLHGSALFAAVEVEVDTTRMTAV